MAELLPTLLFYAFAATLVAASVAVVSARNPVYCVLFLIFAFFNAAGLFVLLGAEYIAMTLVIVYVGAVAVLFLFVVMMMNINIAEIRQGFLKYLPVGGAVAGVMFLQIIALVYTSLQQNVPLIEPRNPMFSERDLTNTHAIGQVLYTDYILAFQISGLILLVAMIGAIVLTLRSRPGVRKQKISAQLARKRSDAIEVVK